MPSVLLGVPLRTHSDLLLVSHLHAQTLVTSTLNIEPSAVAAGTLDLDGDNEELDSWEKSRLSVPAQTPFMAVNQHTQVPACRRPHGSRARTAGSNLESRRSIFT